MFPINLLMAVQMATDLMGYFGWYNGFKGHLVRVSDLQCGCFEPREFIQKVFHL